MTSTTIRHDTTRRHIAKYTNKNLLHRWSLGRFHDVVADELAALAANSILDFGCGEGFVLDALAQRGVEPRGYTGLDLRADALGEARARWPGKNFTCSDLFDPSLDDARFDVTMALEVLEHLYEPGPALQRLVGMTRNALLLTVPHEPWFQIANLARGRDFIRLGNHPEHVGHWNPATFAEFISEYADVVQVRTSFPFIIATARPRR